MSIHYTNIQRYLNLPASQYRSLSGRSFSFIKSEVGGVLPKFEPTKAMNMGSMVHDILSGHYRGSVNIPEFHQARSFAYSIKQTYFSSGWELLQFETSYTAQMSYKGLVMDTMGRTDAELIGRFVLDFKITGATTDAAFAALITHMRYDDQIWHYGNLAQVPARYILPYSTKRKCCLGLVAIPAAPHSRFWEDAIIKFGTIKTT